VARDANWNLGTDLSDASFSILPRSTGVESGPPREFALGSIFPNPAIGPARIAFDVPREARVRLTVVDLQGRVVATLEDGVRSAGRYLSIWDGRTSGRRAVAGMFFVRLDAGGRTFTRRLALTR
jgi:hypothetical protein